MSHVLNATINYRKSGLLTQSEYGSMNINLLCFYISYINCNREKVNSDVL